MLKQNDTLGLFMSILQNIIMLNSDNTVLLGEIKKELNVEIGDRGLFQNKYLLMAKEYIKESYSSAWRITGELKENSIFHVAQEARTAYLEKKLFQQSIIQSEQKRRIESIEEKLLLDDELRRKKQKQRKSLLWGSIYGVIILMIALILKRVFS